MTAPKHPIHPCLKSNVRALRTYDRQGRTAAIVTGFKTQTEPMGLMPLQLTHRKLFHDILQTENVEACH
jgi:hypothetical protein